MALSDNELHQVIIATTNYAVSKLNKNSVYYLFKEPLRHIQNRYKAIISLDEISVLSDSRKIQYILKDKLSSIQYEISLFSRFLPRERFSQLVDTSVRSYGSEWELVVQELSVAVSDEEITSYIKEFSDIIEEIKSQSSKKQSTSQVTDLRYTMYQCIHKVNTLLLDTLAYLLAQYEENGDPVPKAKEINEYEVKELETQQEGSQKENIEIFVSHRLGIVFIHLLSITAFMIGYFLYTKLSLDNQEIISDTSSILMIAIATYANIFLYSILGESIYAAIFKENRILANNFLNLLSILIRIHEGCKANPECIEYKLVDKVYSDGKNEHYIAIGLSAYANGAIR